jgi:hypothetical protein
VVSTTISFEESLRVSITKLSVMLFDESGDFNESAIIFLSEIESICRTGTVSIAAVNNF